MPACEDDAAKLASGETEALKLRLADALETLPRLTRTAFMLHRIDSLSYGEIAWRCGMTTDEVTIRMAEAMKGIRRHVDGTTTLMGRLRYAWVPWQTAWMEHRKCRQDRRLGLAFVKRR